MSFHWLPKIECFTGLAKKAVETITTNRKVQLVAAVVVAGVVVKKVKAAKARAAFFATVKDQPKGVVYLYAPPRFYVGSPHFSFNATKIECFLRANKIPYEFRFMDFAEITEYSPSETVPMIAINGKLTGESQFCIDAIAKEFDIDTEKGLAPEEVAQEVMIRRTLDQHTSQQFFGRNFVVENGDVAKKYFVDVVAAAFNAPKPVMSMLVFPKIIRGATITRLNLTGLGWLDSERYQIELMRDLKALEALIAAAHKKGNKYLFNNEMPTLGDCVLFAHVSAYVSLPKVTVDTQAQNFIAESAALQKYYADYKAAQFADLDTIVPSGMTAQVYKF